MFDAFTSNAPNIAMSLATNALRAAKECAIMDNARHFVIKNVTRNCAISSVRRESRNANTNASAYVEINVQKFVRCVILKMKPSQYFLAQRKKKMQDLLKLIVAMSSKQIVLTDGFLLTETMGRSSFQCARNVKSQFKRLSDIRT